MTLLMSSIYELIEILFHFYQMTNNFFRLFKESCFIKHTPQTIYSPTLSPILSTAYSHSPSLVQSPTRPHFYPLKYDIPSRWKGAQAKHIKITSLDTELQMPLIEQCDEQVNAKELLKKIRNYLALKGHPVYGVMVPELVLKGRILGRGDGIKYNNRLNSTYRVQVGALHGLLEGPVMMSDLAPQTEGNEQLKDLIPVSIDNASGGEDTVRFRIQ